MPTYNFLNTETGEEFQMFLKMDELDQYKLDNPNIQQMPSSPALVSGTGMAVSRTAVSYTHLTLPTKLEV